MGVSLISFVIVSKDWHLAARTLDGGREGLVDACLGDHMEGAHRASSNIDSLGLWVELYLDSWLEGRPFVDCSCRARRVSFG